MFRVSFVVVVVVVVVVALGKQPCACLLWFGQDSTETGKRNNSNKAGVSSLSLASLCPSFAHDNGEVQVGRGRSPARMAFLLFCHRNSPRPSASTIFISLVVVAIDHQYARTGRGTRPHRGADHSEGRCQGPKSFEPLSCYLYAGDKGKDPFVHSLSLFFFSLSFTTIPPFLHNLRASTLRLPLQPLLHNRFLPPDTKHKQTTHPSQKF